MGRRKKSSEGEGVSLFPFLSILACLIGVLTMMLVSTVLSQINVKKHTKDEVKQAEEAKKNNEDAAQLKAKIEKLNEMIREAEELRRKLQAAREVFEKMQKDANASKDPTAEKIRAGEEINKLTVDIAEREKLIKELQEEIKKLEEELKNRNEPPPPAEVRILPSGSGSLGDSTPIFIECTTNSVIVHREDGSTKPYPYSGLTTNLEFIELLDSITVDPKKQVVFLVRSDAIGVYNSLSRLADSRNTPNGKLPVIGQGKLDLSLFRK